ncbi:MAG: hypothetical protein Q7S73_01610 [bacterium]|nr:hypothetical protein [bacterium]
MEKYEILPDRYFENIQLALKHFKPERIYIRLRGSLGGKVIISKNLKGKKFAIGHRKYGLNIIIGGKKVFFYRTAISKRNRLGGDRWSVAYERFYSDSRIHMAHTGYPNYYEPYDGPDDLKLPEVKRTILRSANDYLIEITFSGKIPIKKAGLFPGYKDQYYWELKI